MQIHEKILIPTFLFFGGIFSYDFTVYAYFTYMHQLQAL